MIKIDQKLIEQGYITKRKHPLQDYFIYNYTAKTQYARFWNEATRNCRGLILDGKGHIVARPFKKFFNYGEYAENSFLGPLPVRQNESWAVFDKIDGSLGIMYEDVNGKLCIATRGSFESEQAKEAEKILTEKFDSFKQSVLALWSSEYTFLWEIIYPKNRIVVNYGDRRDLILLAVIHKETGNEWSYARMKKFADSYNIPLVVHYGFFSKLKLPEADNKEGFVLKTKENFRVKVKFAEYVRLHKILTGVSTKTIWTLLRNNQPIDQIIDRVPNEFYAWLKDQTDKLKKEYDLIMGLCKTLLYHLPTLTEAKEYGILSETAKKIQKHRYHSVLFAMWRGKPYKDIIWKMIRPEYEKPFKNISYEFQQIKNQSRKNKLLSS